MNSTITRPTWPAICALEPHLRILEAELLASPPPRGHRLWPQYESAKGRLWSLVGWFRPDDHELLSTSLAWDTAIDRVLEILERPRRGRHRS